jgi:hypothetical protein
MLSKDIHPAIWPFQHSPWAIEAKALALAFELNARGDKPIDRFRAEKRNALKAA